jgi:hypothetical protein
MKSGLIIIDSLQILHNGISKVIPLIAKYKEKSLDYNWLTPKAEMRVTPGKGSGGFAISNIAKGEIVASFGGFVISKKELKNQPENRIARSLQLDEKNYLLSAKIPEAGDMINHSCSPNCGISGTSSVVAMQDIEIGSELTFDYCMTDVFEYDEFKCECQSKDCRKRVSCNDWQRVEIQNKYKNYFSSFIEKLIKLSH